jgi:hypothetical protein
VHVIHKYKISRLKLVLVKREKVAFEILPIGWSLKHVTDLRVAYMYPTQESYEEGIET